LATPCPECRPSITSTTTIDDCAFVGCRTSLIGGAIVAQGGSINLGISSCLFEQCLAGSGGGAIYASPIANFSMNLTSGLSCAAQFASFCRAWSGSAEDALDILDCSVVAGDSNDTTLGVGSLGSGGVSLTVIKLLNVTHNIATTDSSGIEIGHLIGLSLDFCVFFHNGPANCISFDADQPTDNVSCLAVIENSCVSAGRYSGLIFITSVVTIAHSVFQGNTFDYFLGNAGSVAFIGCVFDFDFISETMNGPFTTTDCTVVSQPTVLPECATRTPVASRSPRPSESPAATPDASGTQTASQGPNASQTPTASAPETLTETAEQTPSPPSQSASPVPTESPRASPNLVTTLLIANLAVCSVLVVLGVVAIVLLCMARRQRGGPPLVPRPFNPYS
jgi:hypothetical protein